MSILINPLKLKQFLQKKSYLLIANSHNPPFYRSRFRTEIHPYLYDLTSVPAKAET